MLDLNELEQLIVFADAGTLSLAAERLHLSQPTITRTMQHLEEVFGVSLFIRGKNRIALNDTGQKAVEYARQILSSAEDILRHVREYDRSLHTISVSSCAPAPLWHILPALSSACPGRTIASSLKEIPVILKEIQSGDCALAILPMAVSLNHHVCVPFLKENLSICVPASHELAGKPNVTFSAINGFNFLLQSEIGFWDEMCRAKMPSSRFLVQTDQFEFEELIRESSLPCFTTNLASDPRNLLAERVQIPISDPEANITYYAVCHNKNRKYLSAIT